ncbi:MAG: Potassium-transporting ATPase C chain [Candidatus Carbobacillus altaicus]|uniref:Potassium-transporting ATPase KdpC subunit n=1 Tax=Candidatus Carbonibacillus altaicus TaxID=2163959 RepID=A0A2R6Y3I7_9BACL|nr:MAG: Potassium-transporting ATPase C chain [Candidatus Carbobacillus altaicus]
MFLKALRLSLVLWVLIGLVYPLVTNVFAQVLFPYQANGSLLEEDGVVRGSLRIAQPYTGDQWFHPRPSASNYDALDSGGTNADVARADYQAEIIARADAVRDESSGIVQAVPNDLVTASGSGLDADLSVPAALAQVPRIARATGLSEEELSAIVARHTVGRELFLFGEERVNVHELNQALRERGVR